jgi:hypothetical protein
LLMFSLKLELVHKYVVQEQKRINLISCMV